MLCDSHLHILSDSIKSSQEYSPKAPPGFETLNKEWKEVDIKRGILTQPSFYGNDNSLLLQNVEKNQNLRAVVSFDWATITENEIQQYNSRGGIGVRLNYYRGKAEDLPEFCATRTKKVLAYLKKLGWHINIYSESFMLEEIISTLMESDISIVVNHFGMPDFRKPKNQEGFRRFLALVKQNRAYPVFVCLSGDYRFTDDESFAKKRVDDLLEVLGAKRLLWGSDFPYTRFESKGISIRSQLAKLHEWVPDESSRRLILCENPSKLFFSA